MTGPVSDGREMIRAMQPELRTGTYAFTTVREPLPPHVAVVMTFAEDEGTTAIIGADDAEQLGLDYEVPMAWITLRVHSSLTGVGLTAAVSATLADAGIACNMVAAAFHDHVFVPAHDGERALQLLSRLASEV